MGLMIDFFNKEYNKNSSFYKNIFRYSLKYLSSRQLAGKNKVSKIKKEKEAQKYFNKLNYLKSKNHSEKIVKKSYRR